MNHPIISRDCVSESIQPKQQRPFDLIEFHSIGSLRFHLYVFRFFLFEFYTGWVSNSRSKWWQTFRDRDGH